MTPFLHGALVACCLVAGLFFWRYWIATRDRLFVWFSLAFTVLGTQWALTGLIAALRGHEIYLLRLLAFLLIIGGIVDKNRRARRR